MEEFQRLAAVPGSGPHWYGKTAARPGRKMGHVTICGRDENDLARRLAGVRASSEKMVCLVNMR